MWNAGRDMSWWRGRGVPCLEGRGGSINEQENENENEQEALIGDGEENEQEEREVESIKE